MIIFSYFLGLLLSECLLFVLLIKCKVLNKMAAINSNPSQYLQLLTQQQSNVSTPYFRHSSQNQNRTRFIFIPSQKSKANKEKYADLLEFSQKIDPWNASMYSRQDDLKGIWTLRENNKRKKRDSSNYTNRAIFTTKSWNAEKERLMSLRKQLHMAMPLFRPDTSEQMPEQRDILCFLKRKRETSEQSSQKIEKFDKHKRLLSRIYSHSCQPNLIIKQLERQKCETQLINKGHNYLTPTTKIRKTPQLSNKYGKKQKLKTQINGQNIQRIRQRIEDQEHWSKKQLQFKIKSLANTKIKKKVLQII